jgi:hypothetical protein
MKKRIGQKVIVIIGLILISTQIIYPLDTNAAAKLNWDNPNTGKNSYKFKVTDYFNSQMLTSVVGCTGIVNKIAGTLQNVSLLLTGSLKEKKQAIQTQKQKALDATCKAIGLNTTGVLGTVINLNLQAVPETITNYCASKKVEDAALVFEEQKQLEVQKANQFREECLNGIAFTLAKNQLVSMTKQTMNWVTSGFNGDPMYVRNMKNFMNSIENEIIYKELDIYKDAMGNYASSSYPYARDYSSSYINSRRSAQNFADSSRQDLTNYLTNGSTIEEFASDFSRGGWYGWLGLTQHFQNNPLGFTIMASQNTWDIMAKETQNARDELAQNDGVLSQKKCVAYGATKKLAGENADQQQAEAYIAQSQKNAEDGLAKTKKICASKGDASTECIESQYDTDLLIQKYNKYLALGQKNYNTQTSGDTSEAKCEKWEIVTPGSLIQDKVSNYLGSPERQLEIADDINSVLNVLFAKLIDKLRLDGLSDLNSESFTNVSGGFGSNDWTTPVNFTDTKGNQFSGEGFDKNRPFDIIKDLGNIYLTVGRNNLGNWNAETNNIINQDTDIPNQSLYPQRGPRNTRGETVTNSYFTVKTQGDTKLINDRYNAWGVNDRALWDGESWQNWKAGQPNPILNRGVIQVQQDYIVAATALLQNFPAVMPKLGELDYCLPGPNPNWQTNYADTSVVFNEYVTDLKSNYIGKGFFSRDRITIDAPSENYNNPVYKRYKEAFGNSSIWRNNVIKTNSIYLAIHALGKSRSDGFWKGKKLMEVGNLRVAEMKTIISELFEVFNNDYAKGVNALHESIKEEFIRNEWSFGYPQKPTPLDPNNVLKPNPSYIPIARDGLNITKDILFYDNEIKEADASLREAINQARVNIDKLELIRQEVSKIVKASQKRRDEEKEIIYEEIMKLNPSMTKAQAIAEYQRCLKEEDTSYIYAEDILIDVKNKERCSDRLDNDLDGYIDQDDSDCTGWGGSNDSPIQKCGKTADVIKADEILDENDKGTGEYYDLTESSTKTPCESRNDFFSCQNSFYLNGSNVYRCEWWDKDTTDWYYNQFNNQIIKNDGVINNTTSGDTIPPNPNEETAS